MKTRIITSVVAVLIAAPFIIFSDTVAFPLLFAFLTCVGVFEMLRCVGYHKIYSVSVPAVFLAAIYPMLAWLVKDLVKFISFAAIPLYVFLLYLMCVSVLNNGALKVADVCIAYASGMYIIIGMTAIVMLRYLPNGIYLFPLTFIAPWITDIFAYFVGVLFGKHKLIEKVSPKKTVEGAVGGLVFCALFFVAYGLILGKVKGFGVNVVAFVVAGLVLSVISQFGDLVLSLIKRQYGIKDYGKLLPGHGGVLDRFDSVIAVSPVLLIACAIPDIFFIFG